jgi:hypothetical protein
MHGGTNDPSLVGDASLDGLPDPGCHVIAKCDSARRIERLARAHQAERRELPNVVEIQTPTPMKIRPGRDDGKAHVGRAYTVSQALETQPATQGFTSRRLSGKDHLQD